MKSRNGLLGILAIWGMSTSAWAMHATGPDLPLPFSETNQRVELSDGEQYTLRGKIVIEEGVPLFEVDLRQHPWLKNVNRSNSPYYPLGQVSGGWSRYRDRLVQVQVMAHGLVVVNAGVPRYVIWLAPLKAPQSF